MYDIAVIGAGVIGGMTARELAKYNLKICILEKENDVAMGATKANSAIVHAGFDANTGSLKAKLNVKGSRMMKDVCEELGVKYKNNGFPKVITGIRRCGKSYLLKEIFIHYLIENGVSRDNILLIELDDAKNAKQRDPLELDKYVRDFCLGKEMCYIFIDEIQKVYKIINPNLTKGEHILATQNDQETISFVDVILGLSREKNIILLKKTIESITPSPIGTKYLILSFILFLKLHI